MSENWVEKIKTEIEVIREGETSDLIVTEKFRKSETIWVKRSKIEVGYETSLNVNIWKSRESYFTRKVKLCGLSEYDVYDVRRGVVLQNFEKFFTEDTGMNCDQIGEWETKSEISLCEDDGMEIGSEATEYIDEMIQSVEKMIKCAKVCF